MAVSRHTPGSASSVDEGWALDGPAEDGPSLKLVDSAGEIESRPPSEEASGEIEAEDGWSLAAEPERAPGPRLEVMDPAYVAVPRPIHDDGWALADDPGDALTDEEAAFFARGESLEDRGEPPDTFADLAENRGGFWDRLRRWWRRG